MKMKLRERAALALDRTHDIGMRGIHTDKVRDIVAAWLDGKKIPISTIRKSVGYLEMIKSYA